MYCKNNFRFNYTFWSPNYYDCEILVVRFQLHDFALSGIPFVIIRFICHYAAYFLTPKAYMTNRVVKMAYYGLEKKNQSE